MGYSALFVKLELMDKYNLEPKKLFDKISIKCCDIKSSCDRYILKVKSKKDNYFYVLVEEHESIEYLDGIIVSAKLKIKYSIDNFNIYSSRPIISSTYFDALYLNKSWIKSASITGGALFLDPEEYTGNKIGSYFMNVVIKWIQKFENTPIDKIELVANQATNNNKERRNRFYEQFGITFSYDKNRENGYSNPINSHDLIQTSNWKNNISIFSMLDVVEKLSSTNHKNDTLTNQNEKYQEEHKNIYNNPLRWVLKFYQYQVIKLLLIIMLVLVVYIRL